MKIRRLKECNVTHTISKDIVADSLARFTTELGGLVGNMRKLYSLCTPYIKDDRKYLKEHKLVLSISDSDFVYIDSIRFPIKSVWRFNKEGRLLEREFIFKETNRDTMRYLSTRYSHIEYSRDGLLRPEKVNTIETYRNKTEIAYTIKTDLYFSAVHCSDEGVKHIPSFGVSISTWAKINGIPTTVVDSD